MQQQPLPIETGDIDVRRGIVRQSVEHRPPDGFEKPGLAYDAGDVRAGGMQQRFDRAGTRLHAIGSFRFVCVGSLECAGKRLYINTQCGARARFVKRARRLRYHAGPGPRALFANRGFISNWFF